jgi:hypothetical protein
MLCPADVFPRKERTEYTKKKEKKENPTETGQQEKPRNASKPQFKTVNLEVTGLIPAWGTKYGAPLGARPTAALGG